MNPPSVTVNRVSTPSSNLLQQARRPLQLYRIYKIKGSSLKDLLRLHNRQSKQRGQSSPRNSHFLPCFFAAQKNESTAQVVSRPPPPLPNKFVLMERYSGFVRLCFGKRCCTTNGVGGTTFGSLTRMPSFALSVEFFDLLPIQHLCPQTVI